MIVAAYLALQIALVLVVAHAAGLRLERLVSAGIVGLAVAMAVAEATSWCPCEDCHSGGRLYSTSSGARSAGALPRVPREHPRSRSGRLRRATLEAGAGVEDRPPPLWPTPRSDWD